MSAEERNSVQEALFRFAASSAGSVVAETVTLPTDVAKTRLQVQTDGRYSGFADCLRTISKEEGATALWKGIAPALLRQGGQPPPLIHLPFFILRPLHHILLFSFFSYFSFFLFFLFFLLFLLSCPL